MNNCSGPCRYCVGHYVSGCTGEYLYRDDFTQMTQYYYDSILNHKHIAKFRKEALKSNFPEFKRAFAYNEDIRDRFKLMEL